LFRKNPRLEKGIFFGDVLHPGKLTCPLKRDYSSRKYIFQPLFSGDMLVFRGVSFFNTKTSYQGFRDWIFF